MSIYIYIYIYIYRVWGLGDADLELKSVGFQFFFFWGFRALVFGVGCWGFRAQKPETPKPLEAESLHAKSPHGRPTETLNPQPEILHLLSALERPSFHFVLRIVVFRVYKKGP